MPNSSLAISLRGVSKQYKLTHQEKHATLVQAMFSRVRNPWRRGTKEVFRALDDVSFDINKGDIVGIVGRNGAGKSTLLKVLSRITEPTSGEIDLYGRVGSLLEVGTGFHPELTGRENIFLNGAILGMKRSEIQRQFDEIVDFAEVERFLDTPVKRYSSGMYVRLAFAVAAHLNPEILVVDEVLSVGDAQFQKKCLGKMKEISQGAGRTVIFISHNMGAVASLCSVGVLMHKGRVLDRGPIDEVIAKYVDPKNGIFTAVAFAHLLKDDGTVRFQNIEAWQHDSHTAVVDCQHPFEIRINFAMTRREPAARLFLTMRNAGGEIVLTTGDMDLARGIYPRREAGQYTATVRIDKGLLKCGNIFCTFGVDIRGERILAAAEDCLRLDVMDSDVETESERHHRGSVVAPLFPWELKRL